MTFALVVDDDPAIRRTLVINLRARGYDVEAAADGRSALQIVEERMPDVVLLDLGLPDIDGVSVLGRLRSHSAVPVLVVSARNLADDKVEALDLGADDFITKPFDMEELLARIRAATRRTEAPEEPIRLEIDGLKLDVTDLRAERDGELIHLTPTEWRIVCVLVRERGQLVRQTELLREVWGPAYERQSNYLRVHLAAIRRKLERDPSTPTLFITEPGIGYRFAPGRPESTQGQADDERRA